MLIFEKIAHEKINEWIKKEDFTKNKFYKKYVDNSEYFKAPPGMRIALHILKNAEVLPKEFQLKKDILKLKDILLEISDEDEFFKAIKKFNNMITEYNILSKNFSSNPEFYCKKLMKKILGFTIENKKNKLDNTWLPKK